MEEKIEEKNEEKEEILIPFSDFLESTPPGRLVLVSNSAYIRRSYASKYISTPEIMLHCDNEFCNGKRFFACNDDCSVADDGFSFKYLTYQCKNCQQKSKTFALAMKHIENTTCRAYKFGELPPFGPPHSFKSYKVN